MATSKGVRAAARGMTLRNSIQASHGLLFATPEYNNGIPGVFKKVIDWLSRTSPEHPSVLSSKPVAIIGASPGGFGTILAQTAWLPVLPTLGMHYWAGGRLMVSKAHTVLIDGALQDPALTKTTERMCKALKRSQAAKTSV